MEMRYFPNHQPQALELTEVSTVLGVSWAAKPFPVQWNTKVHIERRQLIMLYYVILCCLIKLWMYERSASRIQVLHLDSYSKLGYAAFCMGQWSRFFVLFFLSPATYQT